MIQNHLMLDDLPYCGKVKRWLNERYGDAQADDIWRKTEAAYAAYLNDLPYYGGKKERTCLCDLRRTVDLFVDPVAAGSAAAGGAAGFRPEALYGAVYQALKGVRSEPFPGYAADR